MKPYRKLIQHWTDVGLTIAAGITDEELTSFEAHYHVDMGSALDFKEYLRAVNGMTQSGGQDCDAKGFSFWPLNRIKQVPEECLQHKMGVPSIRDIEKYFVFADYMQWSWAYAICLAPSQSGILQFGTRSPRLISNSFSDFVKAYMRDSEQLYLPKGRRSLH
jgi:hypothetical protein